MDQSTGTVYLVGAGPGDPRLATKRALDLIAQADVLVYDRLVSPALVQGARGDCEAIYVGKEPGNPTMSQEEINALLVRHAQAGQSIVVRLKGGDPFIFGRGGEEAEALVEAGVPFEVVPGVTAGVAASAYAGIPPTHRDLASAVAFVTAHEDPAKPQSAIDWAALAAFPGTLVFYMGVKQLERVAGKLIENGRDTDEPAAVVERGTFPGQRVVTAPLSQIAERARAESIRPPAITVVGPVVNVSERLAWFDRTPLHGKTVVITRARAQASGLASQLAELGADVVEAPAIRIVSRIETEEVGEAVARLASGNYQTICLTSPNGAELLFEAVAMEGHDARAFAGIRLAAIGPGTAAALMQRGLRADLVPPRSIAESLAEELITAGVEGQRILVARAAEARDVLPDALREAGAEVDVVALYETLREQLDGTTRERIAEADYVTFTSSSTVRFFCEALGDAASFPPQARVVSIGPITSATAAELGLRVDAEATQHDIDGLVRALLEDSAA
jgi:uroporphyrinogen III methyltransferase/synthase